MLDQLESYLSGESNKTPELGLRRSVGTRQCGHKFINFRIGEQATISRTSPHEYLVLDRSVVDGTEVFGLWDPEHTTEQPLYEVFCSNEGRLRLKKAA